MVNVNVNFENIIGKVKPMHATNNMVTLPRNGDSDWDGKMKAAGFEVNAEMMSMMNGFTVLRLLTLMGGMMDAKFTKEQLLDLNAQLNKIKAPKK